MKSDSPDDTELEGWLRANAATPPLPDEGFSQRVLTALPAAPARRAAATRAALCAAGMLAGLAFVYFQGGSLADASASLAVLAQSATAGLGQFSEPGAIFALIITAVALVYAFAPPRLRVLRR